MSQNNNNEAYNSPVKSNSDLSLMIADPDHFKKQTTQLSSLDENDILLKKKNKLSRTPPPSSSSSQKTSTTTTPTKNAHSSPPSPYPSPSPLTAQFLANQNVVASSFDIFNNTQGEANQQDTHDKEDKHVRFNGSNQDIIVPIDPLSDDEDQDYDDDQDISNFKIPTFVVSAGTQELLFTFDEESGSLSQPGTLTLSVDQLLEQYQNEDVSLSVGNDYSGDNEDYMSLSLPIWDAVTSQDPRLLFYLRGGKKLRRKRGVSVANAKKHQPEVTIDDMMKQGFLRIGDRLSYTIGGQTHTALLLKDGYIEYGQPLERLPSVHNWIITVLSKLTPNKRYHWFSPWDSILVRGKSLNYIRKSFVKENKRNAKHQQHQLTSIPTSIPSTSSKKRSNEEPEENNNNNNTVKVHKSTEVSNVKSTPSSNPTPPTPPPQQQKQQPSPNKSKLYISPSKSATPIDHEQTQPMDLDSTIKMNDMDFEQTQDMTNEIDPNVSFESANSSATLTSNSDLPLKYYNNASPSPHKSQSQSQSNSLQNVEVKLEKQPSQYSQESDDSLPSQQPCILTPDKQSQSQQTPLSQHNINFNDFSQPLPLHSQPSSHSQTHSQPLQQHKSSQQNLVVPNNTPSSQPSPASPQKAMPQTIVVSPKNSPKPSQSQSTQPSQSSPLKYGTPSQPSQSNSALQQEIDSNSQAKLQSQTLSRVSLGSSIQLSQPIQMLNTSSLVSPTHHQPSLKSNPPSQQSSSNVLSAKQQSSNHSNNNNYDTPSQPSSSSMSSSSSSSQSSSSIAPYQMPASQTKKPVILGTNLTSQMQVHIVTLTNSLGGQFVREFNNDVTHIVCSSDDQNISKRTIKYQLGIAKGVWMVNFDWVINSLLDCRWVDEEPYEIAGDTEATGSPYKSRQQLMFNSKRLFYGYQVYLAGEFDTPSRQELTQILWESGAVVLDNIPPAPTNARELLHSKSVVICHPSQVTTPQQAIKIYLETKHHPINFRWIFDSLSKYEIQNKDKYIINLATKSISLDQFATQQSVAF